MSKVADTHPARRARKKDADRQGVASLELRTWLRLLACANEVLATLRRNLRQEFGVTLPVFDALAQIDRAPRGPAMGELSQRLMVSKGSVTDLIERLEARGLSVRRPDPGDGRVQHVHLTAAGQALIDAMLPAHNRWIAEMLGGGPAADLAKLHELLCDLRAGLHRKRAGLPNPSPTRPARRGEAHHHTASGDIAP